jgi:hypothetical protein
MTRALALFGTAVIVAWCAGESGAAARDAARQQQQQRITVPSTAEMADELLVALNADRMARRDVLSHDSDTGRSYQQRLTDAGVSFIISGENVGRGGTFLTRLIHQSFMDSAAHRDNILNPRFDSVGIGVVSGSRGIYFVTQDFTRRFVLRSGAEIRATMLDALNAARAKVGLAPVVPSDEVNAMADDMAQAKAGGTERPQVPITRRKTTTTFLTGQDLDQLAASIRDLQVVGYGQGGIGSAFVRSPQYPSGAYVICVFLIWDGA